MKQLLLGLVMIFSFISCENQDHSLYKEYVNRIDSFGKENIEIKPLEFYNEEKEIDVKNEQGNILRFKVDSNKNLLSYHCGLVFILYEFNSTWIAKITTYGEDGKIKGDAEFDDIAIVEFIIKDIGKLRSKFKIIDSQDGNIEMNDEKEKIVLQRTLNSKNELLEEKYISSDDYWNKQHLLYRP